MSSWMDVEEIIWWNDNASAFYSNNLQLLRHSKVMNNYWTNSTGAVFKQLSRNCFRWITKTLGVTGIYKILRRVFVFGLVSRAYIYYSWSWRGVGGKVRNIVRGIYHNGRPFIESNNTTRTNTIDWRHRLSYRLLAYYSLQCSRQQSLSLVVP